MAKSPSITIREIDASTYAVTGSDTTLAIIGFATKGPVGEAQLVTSKNEFIEKYGAIPTASPYGHLAAYRAFNYTNKIIYYRVASGDVSAEYVVRNIINAEKAYLEFSPTEPSLYLEAGTYGFSLKLGSAAAEDVEIIISENKSYTLEELATLIGSFFTTETIAATATVVDGKVRISANSESTLEITAPSGSIITLLSEDLFGAVGTLVPPVTPKSHDTTDTILIKAKETGSSTNNITLRKTSMLDPIGKTKTFHTFTVLYNMTQVEEFTNLSLDPDDEENYFLNIITRDEDNGGSKWIDIELERNGETGLVTFPDGEYTLGVGEAAHAEGGIWDDGSYDHKSGIDGVPEGSSSSLFVAALGSDSDIANDELFNFDILITPDNGTTSVQNAAITLAESKQGFIYIADPPFNLSYQEVAGWHNGGGYGRNSALNSSYVTTYWSWLKDYNTQTKEYTWAPPSSFIAELYLKNDRDNFPWSAPAGDRRGKVITSDIEHSPSLAERDVLYGGMNAINPIVEFSSKGIIVYGQKTTYRGNSAINRINVRRMLIYIKKLIKNAVEGVIFEPHTPSSWNTASRLVTNILETVRAQGGIDDYSVNINASTNTQNFIAQGIMKGVIVVVPIGTIERIELDISFLNPGATITE